MSFHSSGGGSASRNARRTFEFGRPVAIFGGYPSTAWFDVEDISDKGPDDLEGLDASAAHVANLLSTEPHDTMKKCGSESPSPPLSTRKKPNLGINRVETASKDTETNSKEDWLDDLEVSPSRSVMVPIKKDEEEVVKTLSALAEMFPVNENMNKVDSQVAKAKPSIYSEKESSNPDIEAPGIEKDMNTSCTFLFYLLELMSLFGLPVGVAKLKNRTKSYTFPII